MNDSRTRVARAWAKGVTDSGANVQTNGDTAKSYWHTIAYTDDLGRKIAVCCHYSVTTAKHCSAFKAEANRVVECTDHPGNRCANATQH